MRRRKFITLLSGMAAAWSLGARAQQAGKLPTIGFLGMSSVSGWGPWNAAFVQRLRDPDCGDSFRRLVELRPVGVRCDHRHTADRENCGSEGRAVFASGSLFPPAIGLFGRERPET